MSSESLPINPAAFAEAITELPLSAVYGKVSELRNSLAHLHRSNLELRIFLLESQEPEEEKKEIEGYVTENEVVIESMKERIALLKKELENRGQPWIEVEDAENNGENQETSEEAQGASDTPTASLTNGTGSGHGDQSSGAGQNGDDGVYL
ncbi:hypothetical protein N7468_000162 [Penicillium chermesinum]|uniref:Uncharacterized protein n=1 Tax=Penicillium chermesinum TaxID=63820 RepID=A0A9W9PJU3_9EURO|nr:uncharacterized protein N7468_000162 [Penicillium chermesinum]KAJ5248711.1 hypothetical protein N7468_000162 [Penicillium chermesinum]